MSQTDLERSNQFLFGDFSFTMAQNKAELEYKKILPFSYAMPSLSSYLCKFITKHQCG